MGTAALALAFVAVRIPIPVFWIYLPGPVKDVERVVDVRGAPTYPSQGALYMTTVSVDVRATLAELARAAVDADEAIAFSEELTTGESFGEQLVRQRAAMSSSQRTARQLALRELGYGEPPRVVRTSEGFPADDVLQPGDVIVAVDGVRVDTTCEVGRAVGRVAAGDEIELTVRRGDGMETVTLRTVPSGTSGHSVIGIQMTDVNYRFEPEIDVDFDTGRIAGPSAGLMLSLALYDRLTPADLTGGRVVAGTGTVDCIGRVGAIGGVAQKVTAAEREGADVFLSPVANADAARSAADDISVVAVSSFADALAYLQDGSV